LERVFQHHSYGEKCRNRVDDALAADVRSGT
jgi:hypothetical protein